jgi:tRNA G46 methylase TrmB
MEITFMTRDLHSSDYVGNITTEFEEKFHKRGTKINKLTAIYKEKK